MKVLYDNHIFLLQKYGGISRYFTELILNMQKNNNVKVLFDCHYSENEYIIKEKLCKNFSIFNLLEFPYKKKILRETFLYLNKFQVNKKLQSGKVDIFHPTYYDDYYIKHLKDTPLVLTIHDMIHERFPEMFPESDKTAYYKKILAEKAKKIIAISESTKKDILAFYPFVNPADIEVIYHGSPINLISKNINFEIPGKYFLYTGLRNGYKNFNKFILAIAPILINNPEFYIVCAGGGEFSLEEKKLFKDLSVDSKIFQKQFSDLELFHLYKNSFAFIFPSRFEGFGIPVLEAFSCGTPVLLSNSSSLPEVGGNAALYFDPNSEIEIRNCILKILNNENLRQDLIMKGRIQLKKFSWKITSEKTFNVYQSALG